MPIYVGNQKINMSGIEKVYVGTTLVYEKAGELILDYITLSGETTSIDRNQAFSFGGTVTAHYTNGTTADVTASTTFSGYNMSTAGTYTVTASYTENGITKTATYSLTVNKIWVQLWSGSKSYTSQYSGSSSPYSWYTETGIGYNTGIRITFTMSASGAESGYTYSTKYKSAVGGS